MMCWLARRLRTASALMVLQDQDLKRDRFGVYGDCALSQVCVWHPIAAQAD
jgi:hypothetical protein